MIVKTFTGRTVAEALVKVRIDLGANALIVETRPVKEPGLFGSKVGYQVVAASNDGTSARTVRPTTPEPSPRSAAPAVADSAPLQSQLERELAAIRSQLSRLVSGQRTPTGNLGDALAEALRQHELPDDLIADLDDAVVRAGDRLDREQRGDFLDLYLRRALPCPGAIAWPQQRLLMAVGPTGVGKTTTIAKLAGMLVHHDHRRVALATIDTYRVGATDQLRAYADLLDVPLEVAQTPAQLTQILNGFADYDHVLIDTAGRSPADSARVHELRGFCRAAPGIGVMLCVAATSGRAEFAAVVERFSTLPLNYHTVTKLDECAAHGRLYGCLRRHRLAVNYLTTGQEVPDDIVVASAEHLVAPLLRTATASAA